MADTISFLGTLLSDEENAVLSKMESVQLADGEMLFKVDDPGDSFYVIDAGQIRIFTLDQEGKELTLNTLEPGEAFGEMALLDDRPRSAGAAAVGDVTLRRLHRKDFLESVHTSPKLTDTVIRLLSQRARHMTDYIELLGRWARMVAEGDYDQAMKDIAGENTASDRALAAVADAVRSMVQAVQEREEKLKQEVQQLRVMIQIDEHKRKKQVEEITETDYFQQLTQQARDLRKRSRE